MRTETENSHRQTANRVIDFISANLNRPLTTERIAAEAAVSERQLLRIMRAALDEPLAAYIARQRAERAALYLLSEEMPLGRLAETVGYDNPQSLSKAFKRQFGISPCRYMQRLKARLAQMVEHCGLPDETFRAEIADTAALDLVYLRILGRYGDPQPYREAWRTLSDFLRDHDALDASTRWIGLSFDDPHVTEASRCRFYACATVPRPIAPTGALGTLRLPGGRHAVYTVQGDYSRLSDLYNHLNVHKPHLLRYGLNFEEYVVHSDTRPERNLTKIYIPIR